MPSLTLTRVCHSCALIDIGGATVLTDPWFSEKPTYHPGEPIACAPGQLPPLAGVFISHGHYDHCDLVALARYPDKSVPFAVKRGLAAKVRAAGFANVTELDPWQTTRLGPVTVTAAPAKHMVPEITAVLQHAGRTVFFGADTLHIPELAEVASRFPKIDLALLPINGLRIRPLLNRKIVMDAGDAGHLTRTLSPAVAVPIHYAFTGGPLADRLLLKHDRPRPVPRRRRRTRPPHPRASPGARSTTAALTSRPAAVFEKPTSATTGRTTHRRPPPARRPRARAASPLGLLLAARAGRASASDRRNAT